MSIELYEKIRTLEERVAALEDLVAHRGPPYIPSVSASPRRKPGPPKGYKRQPRAVAPNG